MNIRNIVVVRFSLRLAESWTIKAYGIEEKREEWFEMRAKIFKETLYASLNNQIIKPVMVYLLMDHADDVFFYKFLNDLNKIVTPIFSKNWDHDFQVLEKIKNLKINNIGISRIDSDDLIKDDYFLKINKSIINSIENFNGGFYIICSSGYRSDGRDFQKINYKSSPFLTYYEFEYSGKNIYDIGHEAVGDFPHVFASDTKFIQFIHETNIANNFMDSNLSLLDFDQEKRNRPDLDYSKRYSLDDYPNMLEGFPDLPCK
jgi:hypothetical protein